MIEWWDENLNKETIQSKDWDFWNCLFHKIWMKQYFFVSIFFNFTAPDQSRGQFPLKNWLKMHSKMRQWFDADQNFTVSLLPYQGNETESINKSRNEAAFFLWWKIGKKEKKSQNPALDTRYWIKKIFRLKNSDWNMIFFDIKKIFLKKISMNFSIERTSEWMF